MSIILPYVQLIIDLYYKADKKEYKYTTEHHPIVRCGSHWGWKSARWTQRCTDSWNDLGFSLCTVLSICHVVAILENKKKSEMEVSADLVYHCWTLEIEFNKSLSLLIIRLANYSVTTSLIYIYEFLL